MVRENDRAVHGRARHNNPGGYTYHHRAEPQMTADPAKPLDKGWPAER